MGLGLLDGHRESSSLGAIAGSAAVDLRGARPLTSWRRALPRAGGEPPPAETASPPRVLAMIEPVHPATRNRSDRNKIYHNQILTSMEFTRNRKPLHGMPDWRPLSTKCSLCYSGTR